VLQLNLCRQYLYELLMYKIDVNEDQGDQIGRIFSSCVIINFGQFSENYRNGSHFLATPYYG
jgi:hypothetical protein